MGWYVGKERQSNDSTRLCVYTQTKGAENNGGNDCHQRGKYKKNRALDIVRERERLSEKE